ncbi:hypothetical protein Tco_0775821 [Tanacetum coccineum]
MPWFHLRQDSRLENATRELNFPSHKEKLLIKSLLMFLSSVLAILLTAEVPEVYMHQFWNSISKIQDSLSYRFKLDIKKFRIDDEVLRNILWICPRLSDQPFDAPSSTDEEIVSFIYHLGYTGEIKTLPELVVTHMHQPWRTFAAIINNCISGKTTGLDTLRLSRVQIMWGMYYKKNVDFVDLLWEDFMFQIDNHFSKEGMPYPRFTKLFINHFISQEKSISIRNRINMHTIWDDNFLGTLKFVPKNAKRQVYGALIPTELIMLLELIFLRKLGNARNLLLLNIRLLLSNPKKLLRTPPRSLHLSLGRETS